MNSSIVNQAIREIIRPCLKTFGFVRSSGKRYWRHSTERVDVVDISCFNRYNAAVLGVTTYSFGIELGVFFNFIPRSYIYKTNGIYLPTVPHCDFRCPIRGGPHQPRRNYQQIWHVHPDGSNLKPLVREALAAIESRGLAWFEEFSDLEKVKKILLHDAQDMEGTWGMGNLQSPHRNFLTAHFALRLGDTALAKSSLEQLLASNCEFPGTPSELYAKLISQMN